MEGRTGVVGFTGEAGYGGVGSTGFTGERGPEGFTGAAGEAGQPGEPGPQGPSAVAVDPYPAIDECKYSNGECTQVCVDTYDSYYCTCRSGYRLAYNNYVCPVASLCSFARANLILVVDSSRSICNSDSPCANWTSIRNFLRDVVGRLNIGSDSVRVGLVRYGTSSNVVWAMSSQQAQNLNRLRSAINSLDYEPRGTGRVALAGALRQARLQFTTDNGAQLGVANIALILTATTSSLSRQEMDEVNELRVATVRLFAVGLNSETRWTSVRDLSIPPQIRNMNYFLSPSSTDLGALSGSVATSICSYAATDCSRRVMDVVFVVATSDSMQSVFSSVRSFIATLVQPMNVGANIRVGIVTFGNQATVTIRLSQYTTVGMLVTAINGLSYSTLRNGSGHNIFAGINVARTQAFTINQENRLDAPKVIVLITDQSSSTGSAETVREAFEAHCAGIRIFAIGTRRSGFNLTELQLISSSPHLEFHQWWAPADLSSGSLDDIQVMVDNELCRPEHEAFCRYSRFGGYQCFCPWGPGDIRPMNGTNCVDIDECATLNGRCSQLCSNSIGSYRCSCNTGFQLSRDEKTCVDVDECRNPSSCQRGRCINTYGGYFCLNNAALVSAQKGKEARRRAAGGYSGSTVVLSAVIAAVVVFLTAGVIALIVRRLHPGGLDKQPGRPATVHIRHVRAPGFETVRSHCSAGPQAEADDASPPSTE